MRQSRLLRAFVSISVEVKVVHHEPPVARGDDDFSVAMHYGSVAGDGAQQSTLRSPDANQTFVARNNTTIKKKGRT